MGGFEGVESISQFNTSVRKNYNEDTNEGYFLQVKVQYPKKIAWSSQWFTISIWKKWRLKKLKNL